ncbi:MAG: trimethylamine methyltransferase family protein [Alphaproteobacteria bacterium]|jgi:trimethylamine---corrinoid protein Co-methyltransferase|nr:trimethylamine methyltransferase family protein [Alphaproteobacteria bacterium]MBT4084742.1 trimethylamine methyltransferase family protein [Alphaproteobacteria bacterium]MBT4544698.1 trimethylamine methyltransferase family protein [Alphaproteobacteria bacterium]MBT7744888.1 trimethylamine methyltransferase family protein [Alphaproteobacteria bacterium]
MSDKPARGGRRGREARKAQRASTPVAVSPYIKRNIPCTQILDEEGLQLIEANADTILEETGIDFRGHARALELWKEAGADVDGERVRIPRGLAHKILKTAPREFTQHARNPARSVVIGGNNTVFAPVYGAPFVTDMERGRRYGTIEDFRDFVKLAYLEPNIHHSGGTVCEPVDLPVNKRHLDMVYSHMRWSDKAFMGSVTAPERAADTVEMSGILFGKEFVDQNCVVINLINSNAPLVFDATMLGAAEVYAAANQASIISPFILAGAMSPVTAAGTLAQLLAEAMAGMAFTQLVRPGSPVVFGTFVSSISMQSGAPTFGTPEGTMILTAAAQLARRLGVPFRSGGSLTASKVADAQAAYESTNTLLPTLQAGVNFSLHAAGWLEGGLSAGFEKFILDADQLGGMAVLAKGIDLTENGQAMDAIRETEPGSHHLGSAHTQANFESAFYRYATADNNSYEQWDADGREDACTRAHKIYKEKLVSYEAPPIDPGIDEALQAFMTQRKEAEPDSNI